MNQRPSLPIYNIPRSMPPNATRAQMDAHAALQAKLDAEREDPHLDPDDVRGFTAEDLSERIRQHNHLLDVIRADAKSAGRDLNAREEHRVNEIEESLAVFLAEAERRGSQRQPRVAPPSDPGFRNRFAGPHGQDEPHRAGILLGADIRNAAERIFGKAQARSNWESSAEFFRALVNRMHDPRLFENSGREGTGTDGGFAVPPDFWRGVVDQMMQEAVLAPRCALYPTGSNEIGIPMPDVQSDATNLGTAGLIARWTAELESSSAQTMKWRMVSVALKKIMLIAQASSELIEDSPTFVRELQKYMAIEGALALDHAILSGTGTGMPLGIIGAPGAIEVLAESGQVADTILFQNLKNLWGRVHPAAQKKAIWVASQDLQPQLMSMTFPGNDGLPVLLSGGQNDAAAGAPSQTIFGAPIVFTEVAPALGDTGDLSLCDLSGYALAMKDGATITFDNGLGADSFETDSARWKLRMRANGLPIENKPRSMRNGGVTRARFAYLAAR